jgi:hypothetical protein
MSQQQGFGGEDIKEESGWRYPMAIFTITILLSGIFLYTYVGPSGDELLGNTPKPTISDEPVSAVIAGERFTVSANHTVFPRDRRPGERKNLALYAFWPTMSGYAPARRTDFIDNDKDSRRIDIIISKRRTPFSESERLEYIYMPQVMDKRGTPDQYGLTKYTFKDRGTNTETSGFASRVLYLGAAADDSDQLVLLFCYQEHNVLAADCYREYELNDTISVRYMFKRPYLPEWSQIDLKVREFVAALHQPIEAE